MNLKVGRTSEQCAWGHPDFVADIISDSLLDLALSKNEDARCGIETMTCTDEVIIRGEVGGVRVYSKRSSQENRLHQCSWLFV